MLAAHRREALQAQADRRALLQGRTSRWGVAWSFQAPASSGQLPLYPGSSGARLIYPHLRMCMCCNELWMVSPSRHQQFASS